MGHRGTMFTQTLKNNMQQLITLLHELLATNPKDRYIKGHTKDLLTRLQALNPQDHD